MMVLCTPQGEIVLLATLITLILMVIFHGPLQLARVREERKLLEEALKLSHQKCQKIYQRMCEAEDALEHPSGKDEIGFDDPDLPF